MTERNRDEEEAAFVRFQGEEREAFDRVRRAEAARDRLFSYPIVRGHLPSPRAMRRPGTMGRNPIEAQAKRLAERIRTANAKERATDQRREQGGDVPEPEWHFSRADDGDD